MDLFEKDESLRLFGEAVSDVTRTMREEMSSLYAAFNRLAPVKARESDPETDRSAAYFLQSYYRLLRTLSNLSDYEKLCGEEKLPLSNDDLVGLCRAVCREAEHPFSLEGVTLLFESDCASRVIAMNAPLLERLLLHLLSNALKFTPQGGQVTVRLRTVGRFSHLSVSDSGRGLTREELDTVFDTFPRGSAIRPAPHGMGLGLALCRRIAQAHGGTITAENAAEGGARFTVSLPNTVTPHVTLRQTTGDISGGFNRTLLALSDALGAQAFSCEYLN